MSHGSPVALRWWLGSAVLVVGGRTHWALLREGLGFGDAGTGIHVGAQGPFTPLLVPILPVGAVVGDALYRIGVDDLLRCLDGAFCTVDLVVRVLVKPIVAGGLDPGREVATPLQSPR